jgi:hypothetical protein
MEALMTAPFANPPHHSYEKKIYETVNAMLTDVQTILSKLNPQPNDANLAPTNGLIGRLQALLDELKNGSPKQTTHDKNIEAILYAIAQICDQYNIFGQSPATPAAPQPTGGTHQDRVVRLFTKIDSICRDIFHILEPGTILPAQPTGSAGDAHDIVAMAKDTEKVVKQISIHIATVHVNTPLSK